MLLEERNENKRIGETKKISFREFLTNVETNDDLDETPISSREERESRHTSSPFFSYDE